MKMKKTVKKQIDSISESVKPSYDLDALAQELVKYFPHLKLALTKSMLKNDNNVILLQGLVQEYKKCVLENICTPTKYHEIPYFEKDANGNYELVINLKLCDKTKAILDAMNWKNNFIVDDYHQIIVNNLSLAFSAICKKHADQEPYLKTLSKIILTHKHNPDDKLFNLLVSKFNDEDYALLFHEYGMRMAKQGDKIAFINLINFFNAYKNKYGDEQTYNEYLNAFEHANLLIIVNLEASGYDVSCWTNFYTLCTNLLKNNQHLILITATSLQKICEDLASIKSDAYQIINKTIELLNSFFQPLQNKSSTNN